MHIRGIGDWQKREWVLVAGGIVVASPASNQTKHAPHKLSPCLAGWKLDLLQFALEPGDVSSPPLAAKESIGPLFERTERLLSLALPLIGTFILFFFLTLHFLFALTLPHYHPLIVLSVRTRSLFIRHKSHSKQPVIGLDFAVLGFYLPEFINNVI